MARLGTPQKNEAKIPVMLSQKVLKDTKGRWSRKHEESKME